MKLIAAFALVAILSQQQPSVAQQPSRPPIVLAHQQTLAASPFVSRNAVYYAASPRTSYAAAPASYAAPGVVTYSPARQSAGSQYAGSQYAGSQYAGSQYAGPHTVYRPPTIAACPGSCSPAPVTYTARPVYAAPTVPPGYYPGRGIIGQQKLYATGQPIRNALRFLTF